MGTFLKVLGLIFNLGGIAYAMWGLRDLSKELFDHPLLPYQRLWQWVERTILRKRSSVSLQVSGGGSAVTSGEASASVKRVPPADDAPLPEWNAYWERRLEDVTQEVSSLRVKTTKADDKINRRITDETQARLKSEAEAKERQKELIAGKDGGGLVKTWWGLAFTALGTLMQAAGDATG